MLKEPTWPKRNLLFSRQKWPDGLFDGTCLPQKNRLGEKKVAKHCNQIGRSSIYGLKGDDIMDDFAAATLMTHADGMGLDDREGGLPGPGGEERHQRLISTLLKPNSPIHDTDVTALMDRIIAAHVTRVPPDQGRQCARRLGRGDRWFDHVTAKLMA